MKKLVCELCGSNNLLKENGVFVCQSCGTQYSVEEARKMMIEGTVNVQGVVQVDNSSQIENYYINARRALSQQDWASVEKYYDLVLQNEPSSIEAIFYSAYGRVNLSLYDADINKRRQIFNVLINNTLLIAQAYSIENRDSCREMIEMVNTDILRITDSSFTYNVTKNQYGMTLSTDKSETTKLFNALERAFIDSLDYIMQIDPQEWVCQIILKHASMQQQIDFANRNYYAEKMKKANTWLTRQNIHQTLATNPELHAQYQALSDEYKELSQKYIELKQNVDKNRQGKINYKVLQKAINDANAQSEIMKKKNAEIQKFLSANSINAKDQFIIPAKITLKELPEYRKNATNGLGIVSFIFSIVALFSLCSYGLGFVVASIGLLLSIIALFLPRKDKGFAIAGIIINGIIFACGLFVLFIILSYGAENGINYFDVLVNAFSSELK